MGLLCLSVQTAVNKQGGAKEKLINFYIDQVINI